MQSSYPLISKLMSHPVFIDRTKDWSQETINGVVNELKSIDGLGDPEEYLQKLLACLNKYVEIDTSDLEYVPATVNVGGHTLTIPLTVLDPRISSKPSIDQMPGVFKMPGWDDTPPTMVHKKDEHGNFYYTQPPEGGEPQPIMLEMNTRVFTKYKTFFDKMLDLPAIRNNAAFKGFEGRIAFNKTVFDGFIDGEYHFDRIGQRLSDLFDLKIQFIREDDGILPAVYIDDKKIDLGII